MGTPRDIGGTLTEIGATAMTVFPPDGSREGWKVNLRRKAGGWCCGTEQETFDRALDCALQSFKPWSDRAPEPQSLDDDYDLTGGLLG